MSGSVNGTIFLRMLNPPSTHQFIDRPDSVFMMSQASRARLTCAAVSPPIKYLIFQVPGWVIVAVVLLLLVHRDVVSGWFAILGFCGWLLKDLLMYPLLRRAYEPDVLGSARLVGCRGVAEGDLAPAGYVRVRGELWRAVADVVIKSGTEVEIVQAERMELFVRVLDLPASANVGLSDHARTPQRGKSPGSSGDEGS